MTLTDIYKRLEQTCEKTVWWESTSFEIMIGAVLTQNTSWDNVLLTLENLKGSISPQAILTMDDSTLKEKIRPAGYFNAKAGTLKRICNYLKVYDFDIEKMKCQEPQKIRSELLSIKGIGPETADSIMLYGLSMPVAVVDTYTRRLLSRLGICVPKAYDDVAKLFYQTGEKEVSFFTKCHAMIVDHCKKYCKKSPSCFGCVFANSCIYKNEVDKQSN